MKPKSIAGALGGIVSVLVVTGCAAQLAGPSDGAPASATPERTAPNRISARVPNQARLVPKVGPTAADGFSPLAAFKDVRFGSGKTDVLWADSPMLEAVADWLKQNPNRLVLLAGHSDDLGTKEQNLAMGERRARSVMNYLVSKGVEANRITIASRGSDDPLCTEKTDACRAKNRRVHFLVKEGRGR